MTQFKEVLETLNNVSERGVEGEHFNCALLQFTDCPAQLLPSMSLIHAIADGPGRNSYVAALFSEEHAREMENDLGELLSTLITPSQPRLFPTPENKESLLHRWNLRATQFNNKWEWLGMTNVEIGGLIEVWDPRKDIATPLVPSNRDEAIQLLRHCMMWKLQYESDSPRGSWWLDVDSLTQGNLTVKRIARALLSMKAMGDDVAAQNISLTQGNQTWQDEFTMEAKTYAPRDAMESPLLAAMLEAFPQVNMDDIASMLIKVKGGATPLDAMNSIQWREENFVEKLSEIVETSPWNR